MHRSGIGLLGSLVASGAGDFLRWCIVGKALDIGVAVDAAEEPAMERVLQLVFVDVKAHLLAVFVGGQRRVAMTSQAIAVFELLCGPARTTPGHHE
jgi:hypothetical protein